MHRREMLAALTAASLAGSAAGAANVANTFLEIKTWRFHNSSEDQPVRVADYLEAGLGPALSRAGAKLAGRIFEHHRARWAVLCDRRRVFLAGRDAASAGEHRRR